MDNIFKTLFYQNSLKDWSISVGIVFLSFILGRITYWISKKYILAHAQKTKNQMDDIVADQLDEPLVFAIVIFGVNFALLRLNLPPIVDEWIRKAFHFALTVNITWFFARVLNNMTLTYLEPFAKRNGNNLAEQILPVVRKGMNFSIWSLGIVVALNNAGFNVGALLAGMGIGGLAFAMAAKDTVSNFFGGVTVFTDKPFRINDRIKIAGYDGTVAEIGIRSTRLRTLEGRVVTIPNSKFTDGIVENITLEPSRKITTTLGLVYDTTAEQMENALTMLEDIVAKDESTEEKILSSFSDYGDFSLNLMLIYYIKKDADILKTQTRINLKILKEFHEAGLGFAFPTTTLDLPKHVSTLPSRQ